MDRFIKMGKELIPVSEEIYNEYYLMARRERYMENDVKVGRIDVENETVTFIPSKEDSIERLLEQGLDFAEGTSLQDVICDKAILEILECAKAELNEQEQELIKALYYENLTTREIAIQENVSQPTIVKRHKKALEKLRKNFFLI